MLDRRSFLMGSTALLAMSPDLGRATQISRRATVRGAAAPIEIIDDAMGIPHIRANTKRDAFFGQGYVVARDRLFQIDLGRRGDMGRMAEAFGPGFAELDRRARLFHYRGDIAAELAGIPAEVLECAQGYVDGVNARMAEVEANPALLPAEYRILKLKPMRWDITDMVIARGASSGNMTDEVRRARLHAMGLAHLDGLIAPLRPAWTLTVPEGLDTSAVSEADLGILLAGRGGAPFSTSTPAANPDDPDQGPDDDAIERGNAGSNAWTVDGSRTATGRPILANDPHLGIGGFGPRHVSHLTAPGLDVIGGGAPGLPGIMQGHTDRFAFGRTNFHIDGDDLFILETHPDDPMRYRHDGEWKRFTVHRDTIKVAGEADRVVEQRDRVHRGAGAVERRQVCLDHLAVQRGPVGVHGHHRSASGTGPALGGPDSSRSTRWMTWSVVTCAPSKGVKTVPNDSRDTTARYSRSSPWDSGICAWKALCADRATGCPASRSTLRESPQNSAPRRLSCSTE